MENKCYSEWICDYESSCTLLREILLISSLSSLSFFPSPSWSMWLTGLKAPTNKQILMQNKTLKLGNMYITKESLLHSDHTLLNWNSNIKMHQRKSVTILWRRKKQEKKENCSWNHHLWSRKIASDSDTIWCHYSYMDQVDSSAT